MGSSFPSEVACDINSQSWSNFGQRSSGLNCQLSETLRGARFHFIEMHIVPASDELASRIQEQEDKFSHNTWAQACTDIPTLNLVLSAAATFYWLAHLYVHGNINDTHTSSLVFAHSTYLSLVFTTHSVLSTLNHRAIIGGKVKHFVAALNLSASHMWVEGLDTNSHQTHRDFERSLYAECFDFCFAVLAHHVAFQSHFAPAGRHKSNTSLGLELMEINGHAYLLCEHKNFLFLHCSKGKYIT